MATGLRFENGDWIPVEEAVARINAAGGHATTASVTVHCNAKTLRCKRDGAGSALLVNAGFLDWVLAPLPERDRPRRKERRS